MYYPTLRDLVNSVIEYQEDTPSTQYGMTSEREARLCHYYDRAAHEIWYLRDWWPFRHASTSLSLSNGQAALPVNFGGLGDNGYVVPSPSGTGQLPWVEVGYQELLAMRNNNVWPARYQQNRVFAIGPPIPITFTEQVSTGSHSGSQYQLNSDDPLGFADVGLSYGLVITIAGFAQPDNNGEFVVISEVTADEQYVIRRTDGGSVGTQETGVTITITFPVVDRLSLLSGNPADDRTIVVYHDVNPPVADPDTDLDQPIPMPGYTHHALYAGMTWHANRSMNDRRAAQTAMEFRRDFERAMSEAIRAGRPKASRPQQMPMTVGRMY